MLLQVTKTLLNFWYPLHIQANKVLDSFFVDQTVQLILYCYCFFYLIDIELALASGQFSVAGGEFSDKVVTGRKIDLDNTRQRETVILHHNMITYFLL